MRIIMHKVAFQVPCAWQGLLLGEAVPWGRAARSAAACCSAVGVCMIPLGETDAASESSCYQRVFLYTTTKPQESSRGKPGYCKASLWESMTSNVTHSEAGCALPRTRHMNTASKRFKSYWRRPINVATWGIYSGREIWHVLPGRCWIPLPILRMGSSVAMLLSRL